MDSLVVTLAEASASHRAEGTVPLVLVQPGHVLTIDRDWQRRGSL